VFPCSGWLPSSVDGAHWSAMPVVPCAQVMSGQPPFGGFPLGTVTVPETATGLPSTPIER
jgi:hypothetical protein